MNLFVNGLTRIAIHGWWNVLAVKLQDPDSKKPKQPRKNVTPRPRFQKTETWGTHTEKKQPRVPSVRLWAQVENDNFKKGVSAF